MQTKKMIRLLVVDEQASYYELVNEQAEHCRYEVDIKCAYTTSGDEAIQLIKSWGPSVILLNAHLADADSFDIVERCNERHIQVIVTSDLPSADIERSAREHGASAFLVKSDDPDDLEHLLSEISERAPVILAQH